MSEVHVDDHDILLEILPAPEVLGAGSDPLGPALEHDVQFRPDEVHVQDEEGVLDRPCGEDPVEERLARRGRGAHDRERVRPLERVRLPELGKNAS